MFLLICKIVITPLVIGISLVASRLWGTIIGSAIAGLPAISGPGILFLCINDGTEFATMSARATMVGYVSVAFYVTLYARMSRRFPAALCLFVALATYCLIAAIIKYMDVPDWVWMAPGLLAPLVSIVFLPKTKKQGPLPSLPKWKIPLQMVLGSLAVVLITGSSTFLGEFWSGVFLAFPIISSIVIPFAHVNYGADVAIDTIRGLMYGVVGSVAFNLFLGLALDSMHIATAFTIAFALSIVVSVVCVLLPEMLKKAR